MVLSYSGVWADGLESNCILPKTNRQLKLIVYSTSTRSKSVEDATYVVCPYGSGFTCLTRHKE